MEFTCKSKILKEGVNIVEKAVAQKSTLVSLENIFLELVDSRLVLRGNNLEIGIENSFSVENSVQSGSVLLKAKTLAGIVSKIDDETVTVSMNDSQKVSIRGNSVDFDILGTKTEEYPAFPEAEETSSFQIRVADLRDLFTHTLIAVSYDETKKFLNGVLMQSEQDKLHIVATDGYRLALKRQIVPPFENEITALIPYKAVSELNRFLQQQDDDKRVQISLSSNQVTFSLDSFVLVSRLNQGKFPDYKQVIPQTTAHSFKINRQAFFAAAERASIIATASNNVARFNFNETAISISANAKGLGDFKEDVLCERLLGEGALSVAFNIRLLLDVIKTVSSDSIILSLENELSPCKVTIENDSTFTYILMPIRTTEYQG